MMGEPVIDGRVVEACRHGHREAFRLLFEAYKDRVYSIAFYFSRDEDSARDITQETFLKLFKTIGQFRGDAKFTTWLYKLVMNVCMDEQRRRGRFLAFTKAAMWTSTVRKEPTEEDYIRKHIADSIKSAVAGLRPKLRMPIVLRYVDGLSYQEIASVIGCSPGTVASRLNRAHRLLARKLRHLQGALGAGMYGCS